ncbi:FAD-dependent oxidoreductase, partial [Erwinia amylovora]|uniref:FAD-dependent oxidoreductase n=1 Tax=Erwinia amylovora TaxID=552 RepID=UPI003D6FC5BA
VRFKDKERHQLFLEPESMYYDEWYLQGFSTSMPEDVQEQMVHSLKGLEHAKVIENLFTAGQINGTSGYEEAAGQGLIAGINAASKLENEDPLILKRNESY